MVIFPAIDIKNGECVRLRMGDFDTAHRVAADPFETVETFKKAGVSHLHLVDLDGARDGVRQNRELIIEIAAAFGGFAEIGGGIRDISSAEDYLANGLSRVILGSAAVGDPAFLEYMLKNHARQTAVGIDAMEGEVRTAGWVKGAGVSYLDFARSCVERGAENIILTDISRDGMLEGPNLEMLEAISSLGCDITASGGIRDIDDIKQLKAMGLYGAICGKSIYAGTLDLEEAIKICEKE